ncbi:MAG: glycosyltransferase [Fibromonadaceae bacterium]|jgi:glycosyltransferase involved in cell wall biosynthesis|nr:glycosyltransferase [Fibromonadaceae bacterium]
MFAKITVIVPVYNSEEYLCKCLDSILAQTFEDFECILVDDFSKDNSVKICENYAKKDKRVTVIKNSENMGASLTRKKGLDYAKGEYIQFVDSDDYIEKDMMEKMYEKASAESLDIVFCDFIMHQGSEKKYISADIDNRSKLEIIKHIGVTINSLTAGLYNKIIKKHIFDEVKFSNTNYAEDKYISLQTTCYAEKIGYINTAFYNYVRNSYSLSNNVEYDLRRKIEHFDNYKLIAEFLIEKYGKEIVLFEPEFSDSINYLKFEIISDKKARVIRNVNELYAEANKRIFSKTWKTKTVAKILFYLVVRKFPFAFNIFDLGLFVRRLK